MSTAVQHKKKIIDISGNTFRSLSVMAANRGTNLKNFIESILDSVAEEYDENRQYAWLVDNVPDWKEMVGKEEKTDFENWLGV